MRTTNRAFLSGAIVAAASLLAAPAAMATGYSCSSLNYTVTVLAGPCLVQDPLDPVCGNEGEFTGIKYKLSGSQADHVYTLVTANNAVATPPGVQVFPVGAGCSSSVFLGKDSKHEQCVKVNPAGATREFWVVVAGKKKALQTTIAIKKGTCLKSVAIAGLGADTNVFAAAVPKEVVAFKECKVEFTKDPLTGEVASAALTADSPESCQFYETTVDQISVSVPGAGNVGVPKFGEGYVSSGENSCITRIVGGRVYTWGAPCPD
jgi:hypothetical protein